MGHTTILDNHPETLICEHEPFELDTRRSCRVESIKPWSPWAASAA